MPIFKNRLLTISLLCNLMFIFSFGYFVHTKGGVTYVLSKVVAVSNPQKTSNQLYNIPYYIDKKSLFETLPRREKVIVFLGDSITDGCEWSELLNNPNILNRGINSDTTYGIIDRLDQITRLQPQKLFLMIGTNDLREGRNIADIKTDYNKILDELTAKTPETIIYVQSVLPSDGIKYPGRSDQRITSLNKEIKQLANKHNVIYVDLYSKMVSDNGNINPSLTHDGVHLNGDGYRKWVDSIRQYVNES